MQPLLLLAQLLSAAFGLAGVAVVIGRGSLQTLLAVQFVPGDFYILAAVIGWAFYSWLLARPPAHMQGSERPRADQGWDWAGLNLDDGRSLMAFRIRDGEAAPLWQAAGIPTVVCGPAGGGLHAADEWVDLRQVRLPALALGSVGAGTGATTATMKGGIGSASMTLAAGYTVLVLAVAHKLMG